MTAADAIQDVYQRLTVAHAAALAETDKALRAAEQAAAGSEKVVSIATANMKAGLAAGLAEAIKTVLQARVDLSKAGE